MTLAGPINYTTISVEHAGTGGSNGSFSPTMASTGSAYEPRWDYGSSVVDSGTAPAARAVGTTSGTTLTIGYCTFARGNVSLNDMGLTQNGVNSLLTGLNDGGTAGDVDYDQQSQFAQSDVINTTAATNFTTLSGLGWTRSGTTNYTSGDISMNVTTTGASETFTLPVNAMTFCQIDWGDGTTEEYFTTTGDARLTHTYASAGTHTVVIRGRGAEVYFNNSGDKDKVVAVNTLNLDGQGVTTLANAFYGCSALASVPSLSQCTGVTNASSMLRNCSALAGSVPDYSAMTALTNTSGMFSGCTGLTGSIPSLATLTALTDTSEMFRDCNGLTGTPAMATSYPSLTNTSNMFRGVQFTTAPDLSGLAAVTNASGMFIFCGAMTGSVDLSAMTSLQNASTMFRSTLITGVTGLTSLTSLTNSNGMFDTSTIAGPIDLSALSSVTNAGSMFKNCSSLTVAPDITNMTAITDASSMFSNSGITGVTVGTAAPNCSNWTSFIQGTATPATDVDAWLIAIDTNSLVTGTISYTNLGSDAHLDSNRSAAASTAVTSLIGKGWVRSGTY